MLRKLFTFLTLFNLVVLLAFAQDTDSFTDVPSGHPDFAAVQSLKNLGIVKGRADGTFGPNDPVNRAEALKMILGSAGVQSEGATSNPNFPDVKSEDWFFSYVSKAKELGIVNGGGDGKFAPADSVSKAAFIKMMLEAFQKDISRHTSATNVAADVPQGAWFLPYMSYAKSLGFVPPTLDNKLEPQKALTRVECAVLLYNMLVVEKGQPVQKTLNLLEANLVEVLVHLNANNIASALEKANSAVFYGGEALKSAPNEGIVKAADKIARGFQQLCFGYQAGLQGNMEKLKEHAEKAKELAGLAYADDSGTQGLGQQIKKSADVLLSQALPVQ